MMKKNSSRGPSGWGRLFAALGLIAVTMVVQVVVALPAGIATGGEFDMTSMTAMELAGGVAALLFVFALGGRHLVRLRGEGADFAFRAVLWVLVADVALVVFDIMGMLGADELEPVSETWVANVALLAVFCLGVGMWEEGVFRGLLLEGLLARMGTGKGGVVAAAVLSSLVFGFVHVVSGEKTSLDAMTVAQMALKTLQAGMLGFVFAVIVLKTRNLWMAVAIHALNDFLLMVFEVGVWGHEFETEYVTTGADAPALIVGYVIVCLVYLPSLLYCIRALKGVKAPMRGAFYKAGAGSAPVPPEGFEAQRADAAPLPVAPERSDSAHGERIAP